jgi:hypothetical protein
MKTVAERVREQIRAEFDDLRDNYPQMMFDPRSWQYCFLNHISDAIEERLAEAAKSDGGSL